MNNWFDCYVKLSHQGKIQWRRGLDLSTGNTFGANINFAMLIDDGGRRLQLPGALVDNSPTANSDSEIAGQAGRPIRCLTVKPWQLPNHPGPLFVIQALVFRDGASERDLNQVQWKAIVEWLCQGGTIFVHKDSSEIINRIAESAPLGTEVANETDGFMVRRFGLGGLYEYAQPLFSSDESELRQSMAKTIARLKRNHINTFADLGSLVLPQGGHANRNRILVAAFFGCYTFLTGVMALALFRLSQKQVAVYLVIVVVGASILAGFLGGYLRFSQGDLRWVTVTEPGIGGLVQVGSIEVQSAGSRNTRVAIKGGHPDLQYIGIERYYHYGSPRQTGYSPFTWQRNLASNEDEVYQINVPMTLWGRRRCHATAFKRDLPRMDFELEFEPRDPSNDNDGNKEKSPGILAGVVSLKLVNRLPFDLTHCWLVIGITQKSSPLLKSQRANQTQRFRFSPIAFQGSAALPADGLIDLYHVHSLLDLPADSTRADRFPTSFDVEQFNWEMASLWPRGSRIPPAISQLGTANAWIIGRMAKSPIMAIDEQNSDFIPQREAHLFIQEILPEDIPDTLQFPHTR